MTLLGGGATIEEITLDECLRLLTTMSVGRIGVAADGEARKATAYEAHNVEVESWVGEPRLHWIRVAPTAFTGRRIQLPPIAYRPGGCL